MGARRGAPQLVQRLRRGEEVLDVGRSALVTAGDHGTEPGAKERGRIVVGALPGDRLGGLRIPGLRVSGRVAQVVQEHDRVGGRPQGLDGRFAVVLVVVVPLAGRLVQAETVLRRVVRVVRVRAGPAVAMAVVDHDGCASHGSLHRIPGGIGAVHLDDVGAVLDRLGVLGIGLLTVGVGRAVGRADDDDDLRATLDGGCRPRRNEHPGGGGERQDERDGQLAHVENSRADRSAT